MELKEIEQLVGEAENGVERLRSLYDQYFMGIERIEPAVVRKDIERRIQVLRRTQIRNTALRFRFQNILLRYNTFCAHWMRICREIEEGTYKHHLRRAKMRFDPQAQAREAREARLKAAEFDIDVDLDEAHAGAVEEGDTERPPPGSTGFGAEAGVDVSFDEDLDAPDVRAALRSYAVPHDVVAHSVAGRAMTNMTVDPPRTTEPAVRPAFGASSSSAPPDRGTDPAPPPVPSAPPLRGSAPSLGAGVTSPAPMRRITPSSPPRRSVPPPLPPAATSGRTPPVATRSAPPPVPKRRSSRPAVAAVRPPSTPHRGSPRPAPAASVPHARPAAKPAADQAGLSDERVRQIYSKYVETRRALNESTAAITVESMTKSLRDSSEKLRKKHAGKSVDFEVQVKDGRTVLKPVVR